MPTPRAHGMGPVISKARCAQISDSAEAIMNYSKKTGRLRRCRENVRNHQGRIRGPAFAGTMPYHYAQTHNA